MKAIWNGEVIAESNDTVVVEGNHYFPPTSIKQEYFKDTSTHTVCPWKGTASYYTVEVNGKEYVATVTNGADIQVAPAGAAVSAPAVPVAAQPVAAPTSGGATINAPLSGNIFKVCVSPNQVVNEGDLVFILEAMKMETEVLADSTGTVTSILVKEGDAVAAGAPMLSLA